MKAIFVDESTDERTLRWQEGGELMPMGATDVLVDIHATALNRADLMQRRGNYPVPPGASPILGLEMAGTVAKLGADVTDWQVGDRVCALLGGGGYAEQVVVPAAMLMPIPEGWDFTLAAGLPEVFLTAFVNLYMEAAIQSGEVALVHGGASGVGTAAIQLLKASGNPVIVTAGTDEKIRACRDLGADLAINYRKQDFVQEVKAFTGDQGVDVIMDMVGADYLAKNLELLKRKGRLVWISTLSGADAEINLRLVMGKRLRLIGSVLRSRSLDEKVAIKQNFMDQFWPKLTDGAIKPVIETTYPIAEANAAQQQMAENRNIGKIILQVR
ncbi:MAG TPA: NAD(P)H-quinone oxidoreductase [Caldilineaceae bacterium]|nr:NAD(P)H-quinone oxidoreductase [Caldilineaceae bacterium]